MDDSMTLIELLGGYESYTDAAQLGIQAHSDAPATTPACAAAAVSSPGCAAGLAVGIAANLGGAAAVLTNIYTRK